ncbi:hypothetical protein CHGG_05287 [Chaetomium globosum CBS 148.51]|uniref:Peptidase S9 prolyl oligopeptidase catalytic domain-containing protein n=1 Tax=Chaetomium globosum (strain ATCC 6205 / CBS 148.51 / DSM 1962 / NBRC 6347 / NRRL 1970) TaxID=306901 RepID=Q2H7S8_CHAGB|nr:uncharacterized protein CHGG_05287 [Chaetomium globosum CBS 148.51]EAQ88668.1 hypothetical protein CHGG_05287 [Chaetomium globosum CBS 148.51]
MNYLMSYAEERGGLDLDWGRVAIAGASLGGYFALRSAASVRFSACVAVDPLYDLYEFATKHVSRRFFDLWDKGWISDWFVDTFIGLGTQLSFQTRWEILTSAKFLGATTPTDLLRTMRRYTLRGHLDRIKCPVLVSGAADSLYLDAEDHTAVLFRGLTHAAKEIWVARKPGEGSLQAKVGAMALCNQRAFLFLDNHFGVKRGLVSTNRESCHYSSRMLFLESRSAAVQPPTQGAWQILAPGAVNVQGGHCICMDGDCGAAGSRALAESVFGCDRCLRTGAMCVAASKTAEPRSLQPYASPRPSFGGDLGTIAVRTPHAPTVSLPPNDRQQETSTAYIEVDGFTGDLEAIGPALGSTTRRQSSLGFSLSNFTFPGNTQESSHTPKQLERRESNTGSLSSIFGDMPELRNSAAAGVLPSPASFDAPLTMRPKLNTHREAFELGARLAEDFAALTEGKCQNPVTTAVERALGATSQLCEILQCLAQQDEPSARDTNSHAATQMDMDLSANPFLLQTTSNQTEQVETLQRGGENPGQTGISIGSNASTRTTPQRTAPDILLVTTLVTAYILLKRNWRCIFSILLEQLESASGGTTRAGPLELPDVHMGGFQIRSNPTVQILVLLELTSGMLHTIETALGLTYPANCSSEGAREEGVNGWAALIDPVAVSVRETLLSQERVRTGREESAGGLSLRQAMEKVKRQLGKI